MTLQTLVSLFGFSHLLAHFQVRRDLQSMIRLHFLYAAGAAGLLEQLRQPASREELLERLGISNPGLLEGLLAVGTGLRELGWDGRNYWLRGRRARALADGRCDPLLAGIQEFVAYHGPVYRQLQERLKGAPPGDFLGENAAVIARSSRLLEPMLRPFVQALVRQARPERMLEVGCGSGIYLRYAAAADARLTGVAIDVQPEVVRMARENLEQWGLHRRFQVLEADILAPPPELAGPFALVTLYNNVYYFPVAARPALFRSLKERLRAGGVFAMVSYFQGESAAAADFDLVLRSTAGCAPLPRKEETLAQLEAAGFSHFQLQTLLPGEPLLGIAAR